MPDDCGAAPTRCQERRTYDEALATARSLSDAAPENCALLRDLSAAYADLGHVLWEQGDLDVALAAFEAGIQTARALCLTRGARDKARALETSELGLAIAEKLVCRQTSNAEWRFTLANLLYLATRSCDEGVVSQCERAKELIDQAEEIIAPLPEEFRARLVFDIESARAWRKRLSIPKATESKATE